MYAYTPAASVTTGGRTPRSRRPPKQTAFSPTETCDPNRRPSVLHHAATADETPEPGRRSGTSGTARIRVCLSPPLHTTSPIHAVRWAPPGPNTHSGSALSRDASRSFRLAGHILALHLRTGVRRLVFESCSVQVYPNIRRTSRGFLGNLPIHDATPMLGIAGREHQYVGLSDRCRGGRKAIRARTDERQSG